MAAALRPLLLLSLIAGCAGDGPRPDAAADQAARDQVSQALASYTVAARAVDAQAVAAHYTLSATLFEPGIFPIRTRDSIRAFMASFPGVKVDSATATADTIEIHGTTAILWGTYHERLSFPGQPTSEQDGKFVMEWLRQPDGAWLIHRYYRVPLPTATGGPS